MEEVKSKKRKDVFAEHSNEFYSYIPHNFGFQSMSLFILDTEPKIRAKLEMLQSLEDIQVFTKLLDQGKISNDMNELDSNYLKLSNYFDKFRHGYQNLEQIIKLIQSHRKICHQYPCIHPYSLQTSN